MFIGPVYVLANNGLPTSGAVTLVQLKAGANGICEVLRASISQQPGVTSTQVSAALLRKSTGATVTTAAAGTHIKKMNPASPGADCSTGTAATGVNASAEGTNTDLSIQRGFNVLNGLEWLPTPEERFVVPIAGICGLTFLLAPPSATYYGELVFRELRGA